MASISALGHARRESGVRNLTRSPDLLDLGQPRGESPLQSGIPGPVVLTLDTQVILPRDGPRDGVAVHVPLARLCTVLLGRIDRRAMGVPQVHRDRNGPAFTNIREGFVNRRVRGIRLGPCTRHSRRKAR